MPNSSSGYVFISYSRKDTDVMQRIVAHMRGQGINAWVDNEKLVPGTPIWETEIEKAIKGASTAVVILSPDAKESVWVLNELTLIDEYRLRVFPVLVRGDFRDSVPFRLATRQFVDLRSNETERLRSLSNAVQQHLDELKRIEQERLNAELEQKKREQEAAQRAIREAEEKKKAEQKAEEERIAKLDAENLATQKSEQAAGDKVENKIKSPDQQQVNERAEKVNTGVKSDASQPTNNYFEKISKTVSTTFKQFNSSQRPFFIGVIVVTILACAAIGVNAIYNLAPAIIEKTNTPTLTPTKTSTPSKTPTTRPTKTLTPLPPTKTLTPTPTVNRAATQQARDSALTAVSAKVLLLQAGQWKIKLSDSFDNNNNDWYTSTTDSEYGKGEIKVTDGKYRWTYTAYKNSIYRAWHYTVSLSDFILTVEGQETGNSTNSDFGVVFRNNSAGDFYYYGIDQKDRSFHFAIYYNDKWSNLISATSSSAIQSNKANQITIIAQGSRFTFFINDQFVAEIVDDTLTSGPMGFAIQVHNANESTVFEFDNIELRTP